MVIVIILGLITMSGISYLAISKKSSFMLRIAALAALAVMIITVIICLFLMFTGETVVEGPFLPGPIPVDPLPEADNNFMGILFLVIFFVIMFLVVFVLSLREQRRSKKSNK